MAFQGLFNRSHDFVAVRRIRLSATEVIEPGSPIDKSRHRVHSLRNWHRMRRIGRVGSAWAEAMLTNRKATAHPEAPVNKKPRKKAEPKPKKEPEKKGEAKPKKGSTPKKPAADSDADFNFDGD